VPQKEQVGMILWPQMCTLLPVNREDIMDDDALNDAIAACRLLFGQAVIEIVTEDKPITREAISEKIHQMFIGMNPEPESVMTLAISLLTKRAG